MKVLVAIKRVLDYAVPVRVRADKTGVEALFPNPKMTINPFCEIALEEAIRLRERKVASEVLAVSMGPTGCQDTLRSALAMGADRALHVTCQSELQPLAVAKLLAAVVQREHPGLCLLGKQAIDDDSNQTGQMLAGLLGWPQATFASRVEQDPGSEPGRILVTREVDSGLEIVSLRLPAVVTADLRLNTPRFSTLPNIMRAKKKPIESISAESLGVDISPRLATVTVQSPPKRRAGVKVASVAELVDKLLNEAKVLTKA
ncbi:MAG: hypothetical protein WDW38_006312 [Sanguina aurantia]